MTPGVPRAFASTAPPGRAYLVAVAATTAAVALRILLSPVLGETVPYLTFFGAVMTAAWYGGFRPGVVATLLGAVSAYALVISPSLDGQALPASDVMGLTVFGVTGLLISVMSERLHQAREGERREAERLSTTLHSIGDGVIVTDREDRVRLLNPVAESLTGWTDEAARGRPLAEVFRVTDAMDSGPLGAEDGRGPDRVLHSRFGSACPIEDRAAPVADADGGPDGSVVVFRDVSARRHSERIVRQSEEDLSDFFENASVALHWVGPDGVIIRANQAELDLLGYARHEYLGRHIGEFHADRGVLTDILTRLEAGQTLRNYPARLRHKDGSVRHVLISSSARMEDGRFVHTRCFTVDITDRKRADEVRGLLAAVVESTSDAIISQALDGRILSWNAAAERLFGYDAREALGQPIDLIVPADRQTAERAIFSRVRGGERIQPFETERVARDGHVLDVWLTISPVRDEAGLIIGTSSIVRDIRIRKELERSLRESDRRKDEFLAVLAHELRNPLAPIRNSVAALQLILPDNARVRASGQVIERQVQQMARLLDDLLDVSRITHNKLELRREVVTLDRVLDLALETSRPAIDASGQQLSVTLPAEPLHVLVDPTRMAQVFANLISNASKYSPSGTTIRVSASAGDSEVVLAVADEGIGIETEALSAIFEMFSQAAQARDHGHGGVGIGLALVKGIVELHGGRVEATSAGAGRGSRFDVTLPRVEARPEPARAATSAPGEPIACRVLVTDDNQDGADSLSMVIQLLGADVRTAYDGQTAVEIAASFAPQVVFLDLGMPVMDGFETARRLRAQEGGRSMTLVALTGWGQQRDRERTREAGFDAHVVKPVDPFEMRELLMRVARDTADRAPAR